MNIIKQTGTHGMNHGARVIKWIVIHYTAGMTSKSGSARNTAKWFANPKAGGTADFIADDTEIVQYNPDPTRYSCWAVGGGRYKTKGGSLYGKATNKNCINIEICSNNKTHRVTNPGDQNWYFTAEAVNNAVALTKYLMRAYHIDADHVIRHYDVNGKPCPGVPFWTEDYGPATEWVRFKSLISAGTAASKPVTPAVQNTQAPTSGEFKWEVTVPDLNIRTGPGTNYSKIGRYTGKGVFTITQTQNNWGKLKSGLGWISLGSDYGHLVSGSASSKPASTPVSNDIKWTVTVPDLNIRTGPGTNYAKTGHYTGKGTFTITQTQNNWGKLKSGAGWISLDSAFGHRA